jgi:hypothetical protein
LNERQIIILKADDFGWRESSSILSHIRVLTKRVLRRQIRHDSARSRWERFISLIEDKQVKAGLGLICDFLEAGDPSFIRCARAVAKSPRFEIWHHGWDHQRRGCTADGTPVCEFKHTPFDYQLEHLRRGCVLAQSMLEISLRSFGAPENAFDANTVTALSKVDEIKVWLYGLTGADKLVLFRNGEIERPLFKPDFAEFVSHFDPMASPMTLQVHPASWGDKEFVQFERTLEFICSNDVVFMTPYEYYVSVTGASQNANKSRATPTPDTPG